MFLITKKSMRREMTESGLKKAKREPQPGRASKEECEGWEKKPGVGGKTERSATPLVIREKSVSGAQKREYIKTEHHFNPAEIGAKNAKDINWAGSTHLSEGNIGDHFLTRRREHLNPSRRSGPKVCKQKAVKKPSFLNVATEYNSLIESAEMKKRGEGYLR